MDDPNGVVGREDSGDVDLAAEADDGHPPFRPLTRDQTRAMARYVPWLTALSRSATLPSPPPGDDGACDHETQNAFYQDLYHLGFVQPFAWMTWDRGRELLDGPPDGITSASLDDLHHFVTVIVRFDRFCNGVFDESLENGTMLLTLSRIAELVEDRVSGA